MREVVAIKGRIALDKVPALPVTCPHVRAAVPLLH